MREPLAYHLSWTCYGQWLHGDARGFVDRRHHTPGEPYPYNIPQWYADAANRLSEPPCWLNDADRRIAEHAIREACAFRHWRLHALNVQPDHVHAVVRAPERTGKHVRVRLKDRATRALRAGGQRRTRWWTAGGKVEPIFDERHLREAIRYVNNHQPHPKVK
ncbi:MAG: transposase [Planctomycetota bacterium]|nr:transposase [Planctomycetota bacterium]